MTNRTAIIAGIRTPFVRSGTVFKDLTAIDLGVLAVRDSKEAQSNNPH